MLSTLLLATAPHVGGPVGFGFWFLLGPLIFFSTLFLIFAIFGRRWRRGYPGGQWGGSGESALADRFANGDIDEREYKSRLEVLRAANTPQRRRNRS